MSNSLSSVDPKDSFPALIKFGDNMPVSGTLRVLSDGDGNDLPIRISTNLVEFTNTVRVSTQTANTIAHFDASKNLISLQTTTYPNLAELSYVKGVTSPIQTQIDALAASSGDMLKSENLSGLASYSVARANLGLAIGVDVNAYDAILDDISGSTPTSGYILVGNGSTYIASSPTSVKSSLSLNNVENTALSTWAGSSNITTLGTIATGAWGGDAISVSYGGTGRQTLTAYGLVFGGTTSTGSMQTLANGTSGKYLMSNGVSALPSWETVGGGDLLSTNNLSDLANASTARSNLGLAIGTDVQAYSAVLDDIALLTPQLNYFLLGDGSSYGVVSGSVVKGVLSLNNVENTALSTWAGTSNITTLGTISTGTWDGTTIGVTKGGTGITSIATRSILVTQSANVFSYLSPSAGQSIRINAGNTAWEAYTPGDLLASNNLSDLISASTARTNLGLGNVENTALSTWAGTSNITTLGTVATGTWDATAISIAKGGTGLTGITAKSIWVANTADSLVELTPAAGQSIRINAGGTAWEAYTPGAGGGSAFSDLTDASGTNSIDNANYNSTWSWSTATTQTGLSMTGPSMTTGVLLSLSTNGAAAITAHPLVVIGNNNKGLMFGNTDTTYGAIWPYGVTATANNYIFRSDGANTWVHASNGVILAGNNVIRMRVEANGVILGSNGSAQANGRAGIPETPVATANIGLLYIGSAPWNGSTAGYFVGESNGSHIAVNAPSAHTGSLIDLQRYGTRRFAVLSAGGLITDAPSGGTADTFKVGTAAANTPTADTTIEFESGGVTYYLLASTSPT